MSTISVPQSEIGKIRVFAVNRPIPQMNRAVKTDGKPALVADLIGQDLPDAGYEIFALSDLAGIGLSDYLTNGYAVEGLSADRGKLDRLDGFVLLVFSSAFDGKAMELTYGPDLTLIGTYGEAQADMTASAIESGAAQPYTGTPGLTPAAPPKGRAGSALVVLGIIALMGLILWWVLT